MDREDLSNKILIWVLAGLNVVLFSCFACFLWVSHTSVSENPLMLSELLSPPEGLTTEYIESSAVFQSFLPGSGLSIDVSDYSQRKVDSCWVNHENPDNADLRCADDARTLWVSGDGVEDHDLAVSFKCEDSLDYLSKTMAGDVSMAEILFSSDDLELGGARLGFEDVAKGGAIRVRVTDIVESLPSDPGKDLLVGRVPISYKGENEVTKYVHGAFRIQSDVFNKEDTELWSGALYIFDLTCENDDCTNVSYEVD